MAKKTTPKKGSSRGKKPADTVEDAQIVEESVQAKEDVGNAKSPEEASEAETLVLGEGDTHADAPEADKADDDKSGAADADEDVQASSDSEGSEAAETGDFTPEDAADAEDDTRAAQSASASPAETPAETTQQTTQQTNPAPSAAHDSSSAGPVALIFGGVVAGAIGFFAASVAGGNNEAPAPEPVDLSGIEQSIEAQSSRLEELAASIPEASAPPDLSGIEAALAGLSTSIGELDARITALETQGPAPATSVDPALRDDVDGLKSTIAALQAENETAKANARAAAEATLQRAAMTRVQTALDTGAPFAGALAELQDLGVEVPDILAEAASNGVTTLASLQESFPDAARAALAADREAAAASGETGGLGGFLRSQLGARSLTPQEGDSTDAVLSRVEAALREGRLTDALAELETLPEVAQPLVSDWAASAAARASAVSSAQVLSDSLN